MRFELGLEKPDPRRALQERADDRRRVRGRRPGPARPLHPARRRGAALSRLGRRDRSRRSPSFGFVKGRFTGARPWKSALQTALIGGVAAAAAFAIARAVGRSERELARRDGRLAPEVRSDAPAAGRRTSAAALGRARRAAAPALSGRRRRSGLRGAALADRRGADPSPATASRSSSGARTPSTRCSTTSRSATRGGPPRVLHLQGRRDRRSVPARPSPTAARRGVAVRVLADAFGSIETRRAFWQGLRAGGRDGPPLPSVRRSAPVSGVPRPPQDPRRRPARGLHRRHEHRRRVRLVAPRRRSASSATRTRASRARRRGEMAASFAKGGGAPAATVRARARGGGGAAPGARVLVLDSRPGRGAGEVVRGRSPRSPGRRGAGSGSRRRTSRRGRESAASSAAPRAAASTSGCSCPGGPTCGSVRHAGPRVLRGAARRRGADLRVPAGRPARQDAWWPTARSR